MAQNWYLGVLKPAEHEFGNEKFLRCRIEGLQVDFQKNSTLPVELEISYMGVFLCQEHEKIDENITRCITEGLHADFQKYTNFDH